MGDGPRDASDDPQTYRDGDGALLSYTYNRLYTVSSPRPLDAYRTKSGLRSCDTIRSMKTK